jgi:hypothetical protein
MLKKDSVKWSCVEIIEGNKVKVELTQWFCSDVDKYHLNITVDSYDSREVKSVYLQESRSISLVVESSIQDAMRMIQSGQLLDTIEAFYVLDDPEPLFELEEDGLTNQDYLDFVMGKEYTFEGYHGLYLIRQKPDVYQLTHLCEYRRVHYLTMPFECKEPTQALDKALTMLRKMRSETKKWLATLVLE